MGGMQQGDYSTRISVIIAVYNVEAYLERCVNSIGYVYIMV